MAGQIRLRISEDWADGTDLLEGAGARHVATLCKLRIEANGICFTKLRDSEDAVRDHVLEPAYWLAAWMANVWWPLLYEEKDSRNRDGGYLWRHSFRSGADGWVLPNIVLAPEGEDLVLSCKGRQRASYHVHFLNVGLSFPIARAICAPELGRFLCRVAKRLATRGLKDTPMQKRLLELKRVRPDSLAFCRFCGLLGLDPLVLARDERKAMLDLCNFASSRPALRLALAKDRRLKERVQDVVPAIMRHQKETLWKDAPSW